METFRRITMQLPLFELKLKTFPLLHHRDHFVFTRKFLKYAYVITVRQCHDPLPVGISLAVEEYRNSREEKDTAELRNIK